MKVLTYYLENNKHSISVNNYISLSVLLISKLIMECFIIYCYYVTMFLYSNESLSKYFSTHILWVKEKKEVDATGNFNLKNNMHDLIILNFFLKIKHFDWSAK